MRLKQSVDSETQKIFEKVAKTYCDNTSKEFERVLKLSKTKIGSGFETQSDFIKWWAQAMQNQNGCCFYCESSFKDLALLIDQGLLSTRKLKGAAFRGKNPEPDRIESIGSANIYTPENCVLACYYCNNDKSNVYSSTDYKKWIAPSKKLYVLELLKRIKI